LAKSLLSPERDIAVIRARASSSVLLHNIETGQTWTGRLDHAEAIINTLEARSFASIPIKYHGQFTGRLYLVDSSRSINPTDIQFMLHVVEHVTPMLDNIRLLDTLASEAAEQERKKLARDIHDSVIQPYVGLQFGLAAVRQKLKNENSAAFKEVNELCEVANEEVRTLRHFLDELRVEEARYGVLLPAVRRFAARYSAATGIAVHISGEEDLHLNDRLAAEVFQMITEALSNVRRHTLAQAAEIEIRCDDLNLLVTVSNDNVNGASPKPFRPASLTERALALGGSAHVQTVSDNRTVVAIRIPL
jgi:signal transduction histidine kinase